VRRAARVGAALTLVTGLLLPWFGGVAETADRSPVPTAARTFHVDCREGRDGANGRRSTTAWRSLARANRATLRPGDSLLLRRGCRWKGPLLVTWSGTAEAPITIGAYGTGAPPTIENYLRDILVTGSWFIIQDLHVRADPPTHDQACHRQPAGVRFGIYVDAGSHHGVIRRILATELYIAVRIARGASYHVITDSDFRDNNMKSDVATSDSGAVAIDLQGDYTNVMRNRISGTVTCSPFFGGSDGSAVSVYGGRHSLIHHNLSVGDHAFVEIGNPRSRDTLIAYNVSRSSLPRANFAVVHGVGSRYGPVHDTRILHNSTVLTARGAVAIGCSHLLTGADVQVVGNILWSATGITCKDGIVEGDNIYWAANGRPVIDLGSPSDSRVMDPRLVDPLGGNLRLLPDSPAIDAVRPLDLGGVGDVDADGVPVPQGLAPDIGAYEYVASVPPSDAPSPSTPATPGSTPAETAQPTQGTLPGTPTPQITSTPPQPSAGSTDPPPTGGAGALDMLVLLGVAVGAAGLLVVVSVARRSPR
jgi:hypothetical protein